MIVSQFVIKTINVCTIAEVNCIEILYELYLDLIFIVLKCSEKVFQEFHEAESVSIVTLLDGYWVYELSNI